ncbi:MAG TPA: ATP-binding cassette domain-containing protein [Candidatus Methanoperedens sp.]
MNGPVNWQGDLRIQELTKNFNTETGKLNVLENVTFKVLPGEFVGIIGPSGCGKSTLLRLIAGLDNHYSGKIFLNDIEIRKPGIDRGMIFQDSRLLPWYDVEKNIGFALIGRKDIDRAKIISEHIKLVGLKGFEKSYPYQLSGGMAQRVSIARALVNRPKLLLLDEPLGALDAMTRIYMQQEIERIWEKDRASMILVTHDIEEAIYLCDRIVIMSCRPGKIKRIITVPLARPRVRNDPVFVKIKDEILKEFFLIPNTEDKDREIIPDCTLDTRGETCPFPLIRAKEEMALLKSGNILKIVANDPAAPVNLDSWARESGNELLAVEREESDFSAYIRKK